jgi:hypothetical protein
MQRRGVDELESIAAQTDDRVRGLDLRNIDPRRSDLSLPWLGTPNASSPSVLRTFSH